MGRILVWPPRISPRVYATITLIALVSLVVIVLSGAAVRLTGSGLGCPTWPECRGKIIQTDLSSHAAIEYGNRLFTGLVGVFAIVASLGAFLRVPRRRDLMILGGLLPVGVIAQAVVGGMAVRYGLAPGWVMTHFGLSMLILAAAVALAWRARYVPDEGFQPGADVARGVVCDRALIWATRSLLIWAGFVIFAGTAATGSGPHAGAAGTGEVVPRLGFWGGHTLVDVIHWHGRMSTLLGLAAVAVWLYARRRGADHRLRRALTLACLLMAAQGTVGLVQYQLELPSELVWLHVMLATLTWLSLLLCVAEAGALPARAAARQQPAPSRAAT